eukprot:Rhum_TRINITY_DN3268_c0_g1::Rhum_TRINITY_DN3268_c0_g1_i1::g.10203::m.10203
MPAMHSEGGLVVFLLSALCALAPVHSVDPCSYGVNLTSCACTAAKCSASTNSLIECPNDIACEVTCSGAAPCRGNAVRCPAWGTCEVNCVGGCEDLTVFCSETRTRNQPCVVNCHGSCTNVTVVSADADTDVRLNCLGQCDPATLSSRYTAAYLTYENCTAQPPAVGPAKNTAFAGTCAGPVWPHGSSCKDACEGSVFTCLKGAWTPSVPAQCGVVPYDCGGDTTNYKLLRADVDCNSVEITMKKTSSLNVCAAQCSAAPGCKYFTFDAVSGVCKWKQTLTANCLEGFVPAQSSFYTPIPIIKPCYGNGDCTAQGCICYASVEEGFWSGKYCNDCEPGYATSDCNVACSGSACNPCGGRGRCKDGVAGDGSCECGEGWALPSCTECVAGRHGVDCRGLCPVLPGTSVVCSNHGECSEGRTGSGECTCNIGWAAPLCDRCDATNWGGDCSGTCPGGGTCSGHGACDQITGACLCDVGWGGLECDLPCFCNGHGVCGASDPPCQCSTGYALPDCAFCDDGYAGVNCSTLCPGAPGEPCAGHGVCDPITAVCRCSAGWYAATPADTCSESCPLGPGALVCSGHGACDGPASNYTCACFPSWDGDDCNSCENGLSGELCDKPCPFAVNASVVCSGRGECANGTCFCETGCGVACEETTDCTTSCGSPGLFGANCTGECPGYRSGEVCTGHGVCSHGRTGTGECLCAPRSGWGGAACDTRCPSANDLPCSGHGQCDVNANATCTCDSGYVGSLCSVRCPSTTRGVCSKRGVCEQDGRCVCTDSAKWGGDACNAYCGCEDGSGVCSTSGVCVCDARFKGVTCRECADGLHGPDCTLPCAHGISVAHQCRCQAKWSGTNCDNPCPVDVSGRECNGKGTCLWGSDRADSTCICLPDWFGTTCSKQCTPDICAARYPFGSAVCNPITGDCVCDASHQGPQCSDCSDQAWGSACNKRCRCKGRGSCDRVTGACRCYNDADKGHFSGELCQRCADGWTGLPLCVQPNWGITHHRTVASTIYQPPSAGGRKLLLQHSNLAWVGGDPAVLFDLLTQESGGSVLLDACPVVEGWARGGQIFLLADVCGLHAQPRLHRVPQPPTVMPDNNWDGRSGMPACTAQSSQVCLSYELNDFSNVVDATWPSNGPLLVLLQSKKVVAMWIDQWGVTEQVRSVELPANVTEARAVAAVGGGLLYYACGLLAVAPGWACFAVRAEASGGQYNLTLAGELAWTGGAVPNCVTLGSAVGDDGGDENDAPRLYVTLGFTPPGGTAVAVVTHTVEDDTTAATNSTGLVSVASTVLVSLSVGGTPSLAVLDEYSDGLYAAACDPGCSLYRIEGSSLLVTAESPVPAPCNSIAALSVDPVRRLLYVLPAAAAGGAAAPFSLHVFALCNLYSASPRTVRDLGGNRVTLSGYGFLKEDARLLPGKETATDARCLFVLLRGSEDAATARRRILYTAPVEFVSPTEVVCKVPLAATRDEEQNVPSSAGVQNQTTSDSASAAALAYVCQRIHIELYMFDPMRDVVPPYAVGNAAVHVQERAVPSLYSVVPRFVTLASLPPDTTPAPVAGNATQPVAAAESLLVKGRGFVASPTLLCRITVKDGAGTKTHVAPAEYVSSTAATCKVPGTLSPQQDARIAMSVDGQYFSNNTLTFSVVGPPAGLRVVSTAVLANASAPADRAVFSGTPRTHLPSLTVMLEDAVGNPLDEVARLPTWFAGEDVKASVLWYEAVEADSQRMLAANQTVRGRYRSFGSEDDALTRPLSRASLDATSAVFGELYIDDARAGEVSILFSAAAWLTPASVSLVITAGHPHTLHFSVQPYPFVSRTDYYLVPTANPDGGDASDTASASPSALTHASAPAVIVLDALGSRLVALTAEQQAELRVTVRVVPVSPPDAAAAAGAAAATVGAEGKAFADGVQVAVEPTEYVEAFSGAVERGTVLNTVLYAFEATAPSLGGKVLSTSFQLEHCPVGSYQDSISGCAVCPEQGTCDGSAVISTKPGYWRPSDEPSSSDVPLAFHTCASDALCINSDKAAPVTCSEGSEGPICGSCKEGWASSMDVCVRCLPLVLSIFLFLVMLVLMVVCYAAWGLLLVLEKRKPEEADGDEGDSEDPYVTINPLHGILFSALMYLQCDGSLGLLPVHTTWLREAVLWEYRLSTADVVSFPFSACLIERLSSNHNNFAVGASFVGYPLLTLVATIAAVVLMQRKNVAVARGSDDDSDSDYSEPCTEPEEPDSPSPASKLQRISNASGLSLRALLRRPSAKNRESEGAQYQRPPFWRAFHMLWYLVWFTQLHPLAASCFNLLSCTTFVVSHTTAEASTSGGSLASAPSGAAAYTYENRLRADTLLHCDGSYRRVAVAALVLYLVVGTLYAARKSFVIHRHWRRLAEGNDAVCLHAAEGEASRSGSRFSSAIVDPNEAALSNEARYLRLKRWRRHLIFLEAAWRDGMGWWWFVQLVRRLAVALIIKYGQSVQARLVSVSALHVALLCATVLLRPFRSTVANRFEVTLLACTIAFTQLTLLSETAPHWAITMLTALFKLAAFLYVLYKIYSAVAAHSPSLRVLPCIPIGSMDVSESSASRKEDAEGTGATGSLSRLLSHRSAKSKISFARLTKQKSTAEQEREAWRKHGRDSVEDHDIDHVLT